LEGTEEQMARKKDQTEDKTVTMKTLEIASASAKYILCLAAKQ
jgi:hypothetical protein